MGVRVEGQELHDRPGGNGGTPRQDLVLNDDQHALRWLEDHFGRGRLAGMFMRSGSAVHTPREGETGYIPPDEDAGHDGPAQVRAIDAEGVAATVDLSFNVRRQLQSGEHKPVLFPKVSARRALARPDLMPYLRRLRGVTHTPIVRRNGTVLTAPGYDVESQLLYLPDPGLQVPDVPLTPTPDQRFDALQLLERPIAEFPFVTANDRANYLGLMLTPLLRELYPPPYKLGVITAPQPGSGKSLLASVLRILHGGVLRSEFPEDNAELSKQITAVLDVTTAPVVTFDNVTGVVRSSALAGLLTSGQWGDRKLGGNEWITRPNDRLWTLTGNNVALGGDIPRRAVFVTIDPRQPDPQTRTGFDIQGLERWTHEHRGALLAALLTLIRAWIIAGRPLTLTASDSFAEWSAAVSGILEHAGLPGRFDAPETVRDAESADDAEWRELLAALWQAFGAEPWTVRDVVDRLQDGDVPQVGMPGKPVPLDALPGQLMDKAARSGKRSISKSLGWWLRNRSGRWAGGYCVTLAEGSGRVNSWRVEHRAG